MGAIICLKESPDALIACISLDEDKFLYSKKEEIRQEMGIAIGKIWGIWYIIYIKTDFALEDIEINLAISLSLVIRRTEIKLLTARKKNIK